MKILIDGLFLRPNVNGGGETYIRQLLTALAEVDSANTYCILCSRDNEHAFASLSPSFELHVAPVFSANVPARVLYEQVCVPWVAKRVGASLVFFPANMLSVGMAVVGIRAVTTIHDVSFDFYSRCLDSYVGSLELKLKALLAKAAARLSAKVVAISSFGKQEICRFTGVDESRVSVVLSGAPAWLRCERSTQPSGSRTGIRTPYLLTVGRVNKHKNLDRLVRAFAAAKASASLPHQLVIAGPAGTGQVDLTSAIRECGMIDEVHQTGFVPDEELRNLYFGADGFVMPSLYEGFGIPILEAMHAGVPVAASAVCSLPEVGGDAVAYFDPYNEASISSALVRISTDQNFRAALVSNGKTQLAKFDWRKTASEMAQVFASAVEPDCSQANSG